MDCALDREIFVTKIGAKMKKLCIKSFLLFTSFTCLISSMVLNFNLNATEVDSFTTRFSGQKDATSELSKITSEFLQKCIDSANRRAPGDVKKLYRICYKTLGGGTFWGNLESYISTTTRLDRRNVRKKDSIYAGVKFTEGPALFLASLGTTFKMGDFIVGSDKIGHFFEEGYTSYQVAFVKGKGLRNAIKLGDHEENTFFGLYTTGVYSYGDLLADFYGIFFWKYLASTIYNANDGIQPYIILDDGKWRLNPAHPFDWREFLDGGMDEGINCSRYRNESMAQGVKSKLMEISKRMESDEVALSEISKTKDVVLPLSCPVSVLDCRSLIRNIERKFPGYSKLLVGPDCLSAAGHVRFEIKKNLTTSKFYDLRN